MMGSPRTLHEHCVHQWLLVIISGFSSGLRGLRVYWCAGLDQLVQPALDGYFGAKAEFLGRDISRTERMDDVTRSGRGMRGHGGLRIMTAKDIHDLQQRGAASRADVGRT